MDKVVRWSPEAREDLVLIAEYIARDSEYYARSVVSDALAAAHGLEHFPGKGRQVPEFEEPSLREIALYSYRLIDRVKADHLLVIAVIHQRRLLENAIGKRGGGD